jgi:hypothetical protein
LSMFAGRSRSDGRMLKSTARCPDREGNNIRCSGLPKPPMRG